MRFRIRAFSRFRSSSVFGVLLIGYFWFVLIGYNYNVFALFVPLVLSKFCVIVCSKMLVRLLLVSSSLVCLMLVRLLFVCLWLDCLLLVRLLLVRLMLICLMLIHSFFVCFLPGCLLPGRFSQKGSYLPTLPPKATVCARFCVVLLQRCYKMFVEIFCVPCGVVLFILCGLCVRRVIKGWCFVCFCVRFSVKNGRVKVRSQNEPLDEKSNGPGSLNPVAAWRFP